MGAMPDDGPDRGARALRPVSPDPSGPIEEAVHVVARLRGLDLASARSDLRATARRAGVSESEIARGVLLFHTG